MAQVVRNGLIFLFPEIRCYWSQDSRWL